MGRLELGQRQKPYQPPDRGLALPLHMASYGAKERERCKMKEDSLPFMFENHFHWIVFPLWSSHFK